MLIIANIISFEDYFLNPFPVVDEMALSVPRDANTLEKIKYFVLCYNMPKLLLYGDSHITRLEDWIKKAFVATDMFEPKLLDHKAMKGIEFCAVGGTKFDTVHAKVCGINVPLHQRWRGNQWKRITEDINFKADGIILSLGGNDTGSFDDKIRNKLAQKALLQHIPQELLTDAQKEIITFDAMAEKDKTLKTIVGNIDEVFGRLYKHFENACITYVGLWPHVRLVA